MSQQYVLHFKSAQHSYNCYPLYYMQHCKDNLIFCAILFYAQLLQWKCSICSSTAKRQPAPMPPVSLSAPKSVILPVLAWQFAGQNRQDLQQSCYWHSAPNDDRTTPAHTIFLCSKCNIHISLVYIILKFASEDPFPINTYNFSIMNNSEIARKVHVFVCACPKNSIK